MNKQQERAEKIIEITKRWGFEITPDKFIISFWDLVFNLNNSWYAKLFINERYKNPKHDSCIDWGIEYYNLYLFDRIINYTIARMPNARKLLNKTSNNYSTYYEIRTK